jgi:hypothetical protein
LDVLIDNVVLAVNAGRVPRRPEDVTVRSRPSPFYQVLPPRVLVPLAVLVVLLAGVLVAAVSW